MAVPLKLHNPQPIIDAVGSARRKTAGFGRFASKGYLTAITPGVENPWIFTGFMVRVAGDVVIVGTDAEEFLMPACQPGVQYFAPGVMISVTGTTATGIFVYGGA